ncbi:hypothetical protein llap_3213 [Limosa lapponica baueri]|uniref:Uncharacterized protein n=1 Tax=Limosa lapponica baueri TaxID=1758121 RepID=A0A2I0UKB6_LIMLA|nr:hypothetical protein llap_3213 [Limosa lapponica baueri]
MLEQAPGRTWDPMLDQFVPEGLHPVEMTHAGEVHGELQPVGRNHVGEVQGGLSPKEGPRAGAGEECEESSRQEERSSRDNV